MRNIKLHKSAIQLIAKFFTVSFLCLLIVNTVNAENLNAKNRFNFQYAAKIVCTANIPGTSQTSSSVLPGRYSTAVNIHNPHYKPIRLRRKVAVSSGKVLKFQPVICI